MAMILNMTRLLVILLVLCTATPALAQTTGGVFGPAVRADDRSAQFRIAVSPGENGGSDRWAARAHYQHGFSDALRGRIVLSGNDIETGDFETTFVQGELQWQFKTDPGWKSALRFDARLAEDDDGADQLGVNWTNQVPLGDRLSLTALVLTNLQTGSRRADGIGIETRASLAYTLDGGTTLAIDSFDAYGRSTDIGRFKEQAHRIGPRVSHAFGDVTVLAGALFGWTDGARDTDLRLWIGKGF